MARRWFANPLETVAIWWRIERCDGVTLGFTSHDRDLAADGLVYRTAPGMAPSAIRRTGGFEADSAEIAGALSHDAIREDDLALGRFDGARVLAGLIDWETLERETLYAGTIGAVTNEGTAFAAELRSLKADLAREIVPRTSPTCRAAFCGAGCTLSPARFGHETAIAAIAPDRATVQLAEGSDPALLEFGTLRWIDGDECGLVRQIDAAGSGWLLLDAPVAATTRPGARVQVREGCDRTLTTCATRFANAANFQGEPFLPGNDLLTRYPPVGG